MKLPNNYGQICKLSGNRRRPFMVRKTIGYENKGRAIYHIVGYYANRADALDALAKFNNTDIPTPTITLSKVFKLWFPTHSKHVSTTAISEQFNFAINFNRPLACLATLSGSISDTMTLRIGGLSNSSFTVTLSRSNTQGAGLYFFAFGI